MKLKAKVEINGKEIEMNIEVSEEELAKLQKKDTGYGFGSHDEKHYAVDYDNNIIELRYEKVYEKCDKGCNLYHNKKLAKDDARADLLMRQLRRFAAEHNQKNLDWNNPIVSKYNIQYNTRIDQLQVSRWCEIQYFGSIYFDSEETAQLAIDTFRDELMWYFTEYKL